MPLYLVECRVCGERDRRLLPGPEALKGLTCRILKRGSTEGGVKSGIECSGEVVRVGKDAPTVHNKEVISLPHMLKPVERFSDATELYEKRSKEDYRSSK